MFRSTCRVLLFVAAVSNVATARQQPLPPRATPGAASQEEVTLLVNGYAFLAQGNYQQAFEKASEARGRFPRSVAVLTFAIEVEIARGGAKAGLDEYERWLGGRTLEEPAMLRRIAIASLREFVAQTQDGISRDAALWALVDDGDAGAYTEIFQNAQTQDTGALRRLAARGDERAVAALIDGGLMAMRTPNALATIVSLGDSRSPRVIEPLTRKLTDPEPGVRGTAAEALAKAGGPAMIARIKPLLTDERSFVRASAAGALFRLNDFSGMTVLQELLDSEIAKGRLRAVQLMASRPDAAWQNTVRGLLQDTDPQTRLEAAQLLVEHDPETARGALERLANDPNPSIRQDATRQLASDVKATFPTLRRLMRHEDWLTRVNAAASITTLTR
jgi:HEAT repeat protein